MTHKELDDLAEKHGFRVVRVEIESANYLVNIFVDAIDKNTTVYDYFRLKDAIRDNTPVGTIYFVSRTGG